MRRVRIGGGAGYSGDRIEPAVELARSGDIQYLVFECLAERTIAIAQQAKLRDATLGYDPLLVDRMQAVLDICAAKRIKIITNMGAANPVEGARQINQVAQSMGLRKLKIAAITGDDVLATLRDSDVKIEESGAPIRSLGKKLISANAYVGAEPMVEALRAGADVVITGRCADPSLILAPLIHEFGWSVDDWDRLGKGTMVGHLLECAGQVTGGYFADPGFKDIPDLARLGFPIADVGPDGSVVIAKVEGSGGRVVPATCKEQLLYEVHDPAAYLTPDVVADFSRVSVEQVGPDRVAVRDATGRPRPQSLKVSIGYIDCYIGEGQMSYAGPGAAARARLALDIVAERLKIAEVKYSEIRYDLIGVDAIHGSNLSRMECDPYEVRIRVAGRTDLMKEAIRIGNEVEALYTSGPAAGGGAWKSAREIVAMYSALIPRDLVVPSVHYIES